MKKNINTLSSDISQNVQSISDSVLSFEQNEKDILEIIGKQFETDSTGKPTIEGMKNLSKAMEIYSDKHFETARYLFVKDGFITRHIAVSSQTPSSTVIKPDKDFLFTMKTYAKETGSQVVFLHNHPSGYVEPSDADIELTEYLNNFFTESDGTSYFSGHIILDHGTFGLFDAKKRNWNALIDDKIFPLEELQKHYEIQLSELGTLIEFNKNRTIAEQSVIKLAELAKKCDEGNVWNNRDWIPAFLMTGNGVVTSLEYINVLEFQNESVLSEKLKSIGREFGSENIVFLPQQRQQFLMCERFAQDTGKVREVIYQNTDGTFELSRFSNGNIFNDLRIDDIIKEDSEQNKNLVEEKILYEQSVNKNINNKKENNEMTEMKKEDITVEKSSAKMNPKNTATNYVLEKLSKAGIEVVQDKDEFEKILETERILQKMNISLSKDEVEKFFQFKPDEVRKFHAAIDNYENTKTNKLALNLIGKIPPIMKALGIPDEPIEIENRIIEKILRESPRFQEDSFHNLTVDDLKAIPDALANPVMVFKSATKKDSFVFFTERKDYKNDSIIIPLAVNKQKGRLIINEVTSMYGKDDDFVNRNILNNNLLYVDEERYKEYATWLNKKNHRVSVSSQLQLLGQRLTKLDGYDLNILTKERLVNFLSSQIYINPHQIRNGTVYGFTHEGKIYLNPDVLSSNTPIHEYTHLWDKYTEKTNPELWEKGKEAFKQTSLWNEVISDPNYADIKDDENLVLSECHARICGKMAEKVLEKIAELDGEQAKFDAIDWNREVNEFIAEEFGIRPELGTENYVSDSIKALELNEFLSAPMKDLFINERELKMTNKIEQENKIMDSVKNQSETKVKGLHKSFEYDGLTYIPVRSLSKEEKEIINNRTPKEIWQNAIIEKPKNGDDYSLNDFIEKAQAETGNENADLFYCIEKGKFFTPVENGIVNLNENSINEHFNVELQNFYNSPDIQDIIKTNRPLVFDKTKDMELTNNLTSVISDGEVFTQKNENLGDIRVKLGNPKNNGISHIIKRRMDKLIQHDGKSYDEAVKETSAILFLAVRNISEAPAVKETNGRYAVYKNGIKTAIDSDKYGRFVVTGFDFEDTKQEAADSIKSVNALYGYTPEFLEIYAQVGAAYASLSNNITLTNPAVNNQFDKQIANAAETETEKNVSEKESELLKQNKELLKQKEQFQKMLERLTNEITSLRKENEAIKQQVFVNKEQTANDSLAAENNREPEHPVAANLVNKDGFGRNTAYKPNTIVPKFGVYDEKTESYRIIKNARFSKFIDDEVNPGFGKVVLDITEEDGSHVEFTMEEKEYNQMINNVQELEERKMNRDPNSFEWKKAHMDYAMKMKLDENMYRLNTPENFRHNFRIQCRHNNAHNPEQALKIAGLMYKNMTRNDKKRFLEMRAAWDKKSKGSFDRMLVEEFNQNHQKTGLNIEKIVSDTFNPEKAELEMNPVYATLKKGDLIENTRTRVGDAIPLAMTIKNVMGESMKMEKTEWKIMSVEKGIHKETAFLYDEKTKSYQVIPLEKLVNHIHKIEKEQEKDKRKTIKKDQKLAGFER